MFAGIFIGGCNYTTQRTFEKTPTADEEDPQPNYDISLDEDYQDYVSFMFMGNRNENFSTYFNTYFMASADFEDAYNLYRTSTVASFNKRLDSLNITPAISNEIKEKLTKVIERASKVIQIHKNSKYLDDAVLLIGKSYFYLGDYLQAERKFNEFLTNLSASKLYDEAMYYLGVTKMKLGKTDEASIILKNLVKNAKDKEVRSGAAGELGINAFVKKNYKDAVDYFRQSIELSGDKDNKAVNQFILARIFSLYQPTKAAKEFQNVLDYSSDFDLSFYARLNYAKSLDIEKQYSKANDELDNLRRKYREVPEYKQLAELELANNLYDQKKYKDAISGYFDVIIDYPSSLAASDAYYYLARHYETVENNYLKALVNYKKSTEENASSDYSALSKKKYDVYTRYFALQEKIDTANKVVIPTENKELEKRRVIRNEEKGIKTNLPNNPGNDPNNPNGRENGKGSGMRSYESDFNNVSDTIKEKEERKKKKKETNVPNIKSEDSVKVQDTLITSAIDTAGIRRANDEKFNNYYELAELFLYDLKSVDSSVHYLNVILDKFQEEDKTSRTMYTLATIYANNNQPDKANELYREIIQKYPNTIFANESRKILGVTTIELEEETVKELYKDAEKRLLAGSSRDAVTILTNLKDKYPGSELLPKTYYTLGWIYENVYRNKDSVIYYYRALKEKYPNSEYSQKITEKLAILDYKPEDSLKTKTLLDSNGNPIAMDSLSVRMPADTLNQKIENPTGTDTKEQELDDLLKDKTPDEILKILQDDAKKSQEEEFKKQQENNKQDPGKEPEPPK
ncbi:MAG: tetratricopeptide repeat protein [Bacteroidetes bacterium]|nr:tetratricopeptide repeat protein [Bacteroidota bacterium]